MKGVGRTVMVGTKLEEFGAEVLGVMRDVSPGRDMVLCRLTGCNLEHAGHHPGDERQPDLHRRQAAGGGGVRLGIRQGPDRRGHAVLADDPVRAVERSADRGRVEGACRARSSTRRRCPVPLLIDGLADDGLETVVDDSSQPIPVSGGGMGGMTPIVTPLAAVGVQPSGLEPAGRSAASARAWPRWPAGPRPSGSSARRAIARSSPARRSRSRMVTGDFDLSGIGTVTHVEGDRVYGFGHPMFSLGACEFPMMTGYIHTVYPAGQRQHEDGLAAQGRRGDRYRREHQRRRPDRRPSPTCSRSPCGSRPAGMPTAHTYQVQMVREPVLLPTLIMSVLTNAIDTEGNLPEELTAQLSATIRVKGHEPITVSDTFSGPRYTGPMGASALFSPLASIVNILVRNSMAPVRIESIDCDVQIEPGPQGRADRVGPAALRHDRAGS